MSPVVKIIFTVSIVLNVLSAGLIGGHIYKVWKHSPAQRMASSSEISPEARRIMEESFAMRKEDLREAFRQSREKRAALIDVLEEEEFDAKAFDKAWQELQEVMDRMQAERAQATREAAEKLPAEDRRAMAKMLAGSLSGKAGRHGMHKTGFKREKNDKRDVPAAIEE